MQYLLQLIIYRKQSNITTESKIKLLISTNVWLQIAVVCIWQNAIIDTDKH